MYKLKNMLNIRSFFLVVVLPFVLFACGADEPRDPIEDELLAEPTVHEQFFANLASLCGEQFTGASTFPDDDGHALVNTELNVFVETCAEDRIDVKLFRDGDTWHATWILEMRDEGLHLYHDHIGDKEYPEGEEPNTGYGGFADMRGSATTQYFPADQNTADMLPEASTNVWMMDMDLENGEFVYYLERHEEPRFRAELTLVQE